MSSYDCPAAMLADHRAAEARERAEVRRKYYELRDERHYVYEPGTTATVSGYFRCPDCGIPGVEIRPLFLDCTCCGSDATQWR